MHPKVPIHAASGDACVHAEKNFKKAEKATLVLELLQDYRVPVVHFQTFTFLGLGPCVVWILVCVERLGCETLMT